MLSCSLHGCFVAPIRSKQFERFGDTSAIFYPSNSAVICCAADSDGDEEEVIVQKRTRSEDGRQDLPLHNAALHQLLLEVMRHEDAWPFIRPVQKQEVPDYYDVIARPMDFGTIKYKLNMGEYKNDDAFMADATLVFENCNTYNNSEADVYRLFFRIRLCSGSC